MYCKKCGVYLDSTLKGMKTITEAAMEGKVNNITISVVELRK